MLSPTRIDGLWPKHMQDGSSHVLSVAFDDYAFGVSRETAHKIRSRVQEICDLDTLLENPAGIEDESNRIYRDIYLVDCEALLEQGTATIASLVALGSRRTVDIVFTALRLSDSYVSYCTELLNEAASDKLVNDRVIALDALAKLVSVAALLKQNYALATEWAQVVRSLALTDNNPPIRASAYSVLSELFSHEFDGWSRELRPAFDDQDKTVRARAATLWHAEFSGLSYGIRDKAILVHTMKSLLSDTSRDVRNFAAVALVKTRQFTAEDAPALLEELLVPLDELENREAQRVSLEALLLLGETSDLPETQSAIDAYILDMVESDVVTDIEFYRTEEERLLATIFGTGIAGSRRELAETVSTLFDSTNSLVRRKAVNVWSRTRTQAMPATQVLPLLEDTDTRVKLDALQALRTTDVLQKQVLDPLLRSITDEHPKIASRAASLLGGVDEINLRQITIDTVVDILRRNPNNKNAYNVLWSVTEMWDTE